LKPENRPPEEQTIKSSTIKKVVFVPAHPGTLDEVPERVRQIATLRGLGYSYRQIAGPLNVTPQAVLLMLARRRCRCALAAAMRHCGPQSSVCGFGSADSTQRDQRAGGHKHHRAINRRAV